MVLCLGEGCKSCLSWTTTCCIHPCPFFPPCIFQPSFFLISFNRSLWEKKTYHFINKIGSWNRELYAIELTVQHTIWNSLIVWSFQWLWGTLKQFLRNAYFEKPMYELWKFSNPNLILLFTCLRKHLLFKTFATLLNFLFNNHSFHSGWSWC